MAKHWIAQATAHNKGAFSGAARARGLTTAQYERKVLAEHSHASQKLRLRARLSKTLRAIRRHHVGE